MSTVIKRPSDQQWWDPFVIQATKRIQKAAEERNLPLPATLTDDETNGRLISITVKADDSVEATAGDITESLLDDLELTVTFADGQTIQLNRHSSP